MAAHTRHTTSAALSRCSEGGACCKEHGRRRQLPHAAVLISDTLVAVLAGKERNGTNSETAAAAAIGAGCARWQGAQRTNGDTAAAAAGTIELSL